MPSPSLHQLLSMPPALQKFFALGNFSAANYYQTLVDGGEAGVASGFLTVALVRLDAMPQAAGIITERAVVGSTSGHVMNTGSSSLTVSMASGTPAYINATHALTPSDVGKLFLIVGRHTGAQLQFWTQRQVSAALAITGYNPPTGVRTTLGVRGAGTLPATTLSILAAMTARGVPSDEQMRALFDAVRANGDMPYDFPQRDAYDEDIAAIAPRHWYRGDAYTAGANLTALMSKGSVGGQLNVAAGTIAVPAADPLFNNQKSFVLTGTQWLDSSLSAAEFGFMHNGSGCDWFLIGMSTADTGAIPIATQSGGNGIGTQLTISAGTASYTVRDGSLLMVDPATATAAKAFPLNTPSYCECFYGEGTSPEWAVYARESPITSGASINNPSASTPTIPLRLGAQGGGGAPANMRVADLLIFNRRLTESERQTVRDYIRTRYGIGVVTTTHRWPASYNQAGGVDGDPGPIAVPDTVTFLAQHEMDKVGDVRLRVFDARNSGQKSYGSLGFSASSFLQTLSASGGIRGAASFWVAVEFIPWTTGGATLMLVATAENGGQGYQLYLSGSQVCATVRDTTTNRIVNSASGVLAAGDLGVPQIALLNYDGAKVDVCYKGAVVATLPASGYMPWAQAMKIGNRTDGGTPASLTSIFRVQGADGSSLSASEIATLYAALTQQKPMPRMPGAQHYYDLTPDTRMNGGPASGVPATVLDRISTDHLTRVGGLEVNSGGLTKFSGGNTLSSATGIRGNAAGFWAEVLFIPVAGATDARVIGTGVSNTGGWSIYSWGTAVFTNFGDGTTLRGNGSFSVTAGVLTHVAVRYTGTAMEMFVNGTLANAVTFGYVTTTGAFSLGAAGLSAQTVMGGSGSDSAIPTPAEIATAASSALSTGKVVGIPGKTAKRWSVVDDVSENGGKVPVFVKDRVGTDNLVVTDGKLQVAARTERTWSYESSPILQGLSPFDVTSKSVSCAGGTAGDPTSLWFALLVVVTSQATVGLQELCGKRSSGFGAGWGVRATANNTQITPAVYAGGSIKSAPIVSIAATDVGKIMLIGGELDAIAGVVRSYSKRAQVSTGTSLGGSYVSAPSAPCTLGPIVTAVGGAAASTLTGIRLLGMMCGRGLPGLSRWQAAFDAAQAVEDLVAMPDGYTEHLWSVTRAVKANNGVLPATIPDQIGTDHMTVAGALSAEGVYARAWNW